MKYKAPRILLTILLITIIACSSAFAQPVSRYSAHDYATKQLIHSDFFYKGQGMHLSPGIFNKVELFRYLFEGTKTDETVLSTLARRWGLQSHDNKLVGIKTVRYQRMNVGVLGCVACHSGKAAGQYIIGIGNKNIDPGQIGVDGVKIETAFKKLSDAYFALTLRQKSEEYKKIEDSSLRLMKKLATPSLSATTQGLVPVALVGSWFYEDAKLPLPTNGFKGAVKVPTWFGFTQKAEVGQFFDGIGLGHPPGWIIGVEIAAGQSPQNIRENFEKVEELAKLIGDLLPPKYPFEINIERAKNGQLTFEQNCSHCHGTYQQDQLGLPIYMRPEIIPFASIRTDPDRLDSITEEFLSLVRTSSLSDLIQLSPYAGKRMYIAPRLNGIWARFPYLHNGSVPTLRDLLEPPSSRPKVFSLREAGEKWRFDTQKIGLTKIELNKNDFNQRWIYDVSKHGQSNQGHEKSLDLSNSEKDDLVEYLKTL